MDFGSSVSFASELKVRLRTFSMPAGRKQTSYIIFSASPAARKGFFYGWGVINRGGKKVRTKGFKRGLLSTLLIASLMALAISLFSPLIHAGEQAGSPMGDTIEVISGQTFILRHRFWWDSPDLGYYLYTIYWDCLENRPSENFTFLEAKAYFDNGETIDNFVWFMGEPTGTDTRFTVRVANFPYPIWQGLGDPRNGEFNVDIIMRAAGEGGVPHVTGDHLIHYYDYEWMVWEDNIIPILPPPLPITIRVLSKVGVEISPHYQDGIPGSVLSYSVKVTNRGENANSYILTVSDNLVWNPTLSDNLLDNVGPDENRVITLSVTIPENATSFNEDNIRVTATSAENVEVSGSDWCIARVQGKAEFDHITLYKVSLDVDLYLGSGSKLVAKFYTWGSSYQGENVVWTGSTPDNVSFFEYLLHPLGQMGVQIVKLDLTYDTTENVIQRMASFVVRKIDIEKNFMRIPLEWALASPEDKIKFEIEFSEKPLYWVLAPS